ncbi:Cullin repeat-like-containing domain protein [Mycena floridula]|nr:Cullin repeat-like-containing domain protein [Mycena floridula]
MDDESAEIEVLEQNLNKTHQISQRMITVLNGFDTRLAKLEKSILPLYTVSQLLNRRTSNIEKTLLKIDEVSSNREGIEAEEALILRGPQPTQLQTYTDTIERLNATIAFKSSDPDTADSARLVETGAKKLAQLYTKMVAEGSSGSTPAPGQEMSSLALPVELYDQLLPIVSFLRTLPLPATHPSHPAAPAILSTLKDAQKGFADMRGNWCCKCVEGQGKRVLDRAETIDPVDAGKEFGHWVEDLLTMVEMEYNLLADLTPIASASSISSTYRALVNPIMLLFTKTLTAVIALTKQSLHQYTFMALAAYEHMLVLQVRWDDVLSLRSSSSKKESNEYKEGLLSLRALVMRSFPEFLVDLKLASLPKPNTELSTGLADFTVSTVEYMERLPEVQFATATALLVLGDGNWKMGEGIPLGNKLKLKAGDEAIILEHFSFDVIMTTVNSINALAQTSKRGTPFSSIFILNNIAYLRTQILTEPRSNELINLLSRPTQDIINSNYRTAKAAYMDANFSPLMQAFMDDPKDKGKSNAKERFTRFYDLLDEVVERHKIAPVLEDDPNGRESMCEDITKLVVPSFQRFVQKHREKEFSKNPSKYIKLSPEGVEAQLKAIYR